MSERVIDIFTKRPLDTPEAHASMVRELADLDEACEPTDRRREELRRRLGVLAYERGLEG